MSPRTGDLGLALVWPPTFPPIHPGALGKSFSLSLSFPSAPGHICKENKMVKSCGVGVVCMALEAQAKFTSQLYHFPAGGSCRNHAELQLSHL